MLTSAEAKTGNWRPRAYGMTRVGGWEQLASEAQSSPMKRCAVADGKGTR